MEKENAGRVIKFRAWNSEDGMFIPMAVKNDIQTHEPEEGSDAIMQFTGLHDVNGKEIYEGDILHCESGRASGNVIVQWLAPEPSKAGLVDGIFGEKIDLDGYMSDLGRFCTKKIGTNHPAVYAGRIEIIGNIYENPALLK
jgi:uncharacterized phage protein (TIGR01671 family)